MTRLRSLLAAISPAGLAIPLVLAALLGWQSIANITAELDQARLCAVDWQMAIEALEGGATDYQGRCLSVGGGIDGEVPEDFYTQRDLAWQDFAAAAERLQEDPWGKVAGTVGGMPLIFLALFGGGLIGGAPMASATAAWGLSNGWTRPVWARSVLALTALAVLLAYIVSMTVGVAYMSVRMQSAEVVMGWQFPGGEAFAPLAGLLFYGVVGVFAGILTGRGEIGGMLAVAFSIADFVASAQFGQSPVFPSTWHQSLIGQEAGGLSMPTAALIASLAAVGLGAVVYRYMTRRRDVPDR